MTKSDDGENLMGCVERRLYKEKILLDLGELDSIEYRHLVSWGHRQRVVRNLRETRCDNVTEMMGKERMRKVSVSDVKCFKEAIESKNKGKGI